MTLVSKMIKPKCSVKKTPQATIFNVRAKEKRFCSNIKIVALEFFVTPLMFGNESQFAGIT